MQNMQDFRPRKAASFTMLEKFLEYSPEEAAKTIEILPLNEAVFLVSALKAQSASAAQFINGGNLFVKLKCAGFIKIFFEKLLLKKEIN
ncbi:MAG: hypothetical protein LBU09_02955 [Endomicrobium sp.]|jgi:hypothetical protein|nr:hypothetical protein [Endomicrobium sp.]